MRDIFTFARNSAMILFFTIAMLVFPSRAQADSTVTDCSNDTQFSNALAAGGTITFNCGSAPVTITFTSFKEVSTDTTVDGGGLITLSGGNSVSLFQVFVNKTLTLKNITLTGGSGSFGAIQNFGTLITDNAVITENTASSDGGGIDNYGTTQLANTTLSNNTASGNGGGINVTSGDVTLTSSHVLTNTAVLGGGVHNSGTLTTTATTLGSNTASSSGGGIYNAAGASLTVTQSTFSGNTAPGTSPFPGGGGGIYITSGTNAMVMSSTLSGNSGTYGGGINNKGTLTLTNSSLTDNTANQFGGGGLFNYRGAASLTNVTLNGNTAQSGGGGAENNTGTMTVTNSTISGNDGGGYGGGIDNYDGIAGLTFVTISGNSAKYGGGVYQYGTFITQTVTLTNTIVANSLSGANCQVQIASKGNIFSGGYNLSSGDSCEGFFNRTGDQNLVNPNLGSLANNGGPTLTQMPQPPSPAIDAIPKGMNGCGTTFTTDQRGVARAVNDKCTIGAVEYGVSLPQLWLPLILK